MRTVFDNSMTAHVWAQQDRPEGRSNNGNLYFEGPTLYSYGRHFVVGHIMPDGTALLNRDTYSISTSRHQRYAESAVRHRRSFRVPGLTALVRCIGNADSIKRHVTQHAKALLAAPETAHYLLSLAGLDQAKAQSFIGKACAAIDRAEAERKMAEAKALLETQLRNARFLADMTDVDWRQWVDSRGAEFGSFPDPEARGRYSKRYRKKTRGETLKRTLAEIHKLDLTARKHPRKLGQRRVEIVHARTVELREMTKRILKRESRGLDLARFAGLKEQFRQALPAMQSATATSGQAANFSSIAGALANVAGRDPRLAGKLMASQYFGRRYADLQAANEQGERRAKWLAGEGASADYSLRDGAGGPLLRAIGIERDATGAIVAGELQTSQGAKVPLVHALRAFRFLKLCHETGRTWHANGRTIRVGHFTITEVRPDGFTAGCHCINWSEVERLAREIDVFETPADETALEPSHKAA